MKILLTISLIALSLCTLAQSSITTETLQLVVQQATLRGTLTIPASNQKMPVALIIAGSGATDQNGNSLGSPFQSNSYKLLAEALAAKGIASLRYDKRGIGQSSSQQTESQVRFDDFAADASALLEQLKKDPRFSSVYIIGHSEGSLLGMLAAQKTPVAGYISLAGPGRAADVVLLEQLSPQVTPAMLEEIKRVLGSLKNGQTIPSQQIKLPAQLVNLLFRDSVQPYLISWFAYDPATEIKKLKTRVMVVQGSTDIQVSLTDASLLAAAIGQPASIVTNMNHTLKTATLEPASQNTAYTDPSLALHPDLLPMLEQFIKP